MEKRVLIQQAKAFKDESRNTFAAYWDMSRQLTDAIARADMRWVATHAEEMALLLKRAASAEQTGKMFERMAEKEGV